MRQCDCVLTFQVVTTDFAEYTAHSENIHAHSNQLVDKQLLVV